MPIFIAIALILLGCAKPSKLNLKQTSDTASQLQPLQEASPISAEPVPVVVASPIPSPLPNPKVSLSDFYFPVEIYSYSVPEGYIPTLESLDLFLGLKMEGHYALNWSGWANEKWIRGTTPEAWYILFPDGRLVEWDEPSGKNLYGTLVAVVSVEIYRNPTLLHDAYSPY